MFKKHFLLYVNVYREWISHNEHILKAFQEKNDMQYVPFLS